ncbi:MAG: DUF4382 domain-containing protein [Gemmatimonadales bacterium]
MKRFLIAAAAALGPIGVACYQDEALHPPGIAPTRVLLTDAPFPYDSVSSVNVYVTRVEASPRDTAPADRAAGRVTWIEIAAPKKRFDLLTLQQGTTAFVGEGAIDAGQYIEVRMTIDVDSSSIKYLDGSDAVVHWPSPGQGQIFVYAGVEEQLAVSATGAVIVLDFDVGRSFLYNLFGVREFHSQPVLRAVNSAATGAIAGTVTAPDIEGMPVPIQNANITVYGGDPNQLPGQWYVVATGRSDAQGRYKVAFLRAGAYIVRVEQPDFPAFEAVTTPNVQVTVGSETSHSVMLPLAGAGGAFLNVTGPTTVGVGGTIVFRAAVGDSNGNPVQNPQISWFTRDSLTAMLLDSSYSDTLQFVLGLRPGTTRIVAYAPSLLVADSVAIEVMGSSPNDTVATVIVTPASLTLAVGDSTFLSAVLRNSVGDVLTNRPISWFQSDSMGVVDLLVTVGPTAVLKARKTGTTTINAVSEGKSGGATITVQ